MAGILHNMRFSVNELLPPSGRVFHLERENRPVVRPRRGIEGDQLPLVYIPWNFSGMDRRVVCPCLRLSSVHDHVGDCALYSPRIQLLVEGKPRFRVEDEVQLHDGEDHYSLLPEIP